MKTLVLISADEEWRAVNLFFMGAEIQHSAMGEYFETRLEDRDLTFFHGGWGKISAAATTQYVIDHFKPDLLVNLGTCGGLEGRIEQGTIILVEKTAVYDIYELMTDADAALAHYSTELDLSWLPRIVPSPVLRGSLISADRDILVEDIPRLIEKYDALAADWESGAIAWVAKRNGVKCLILRGVSDLVGDEGGEVYGDHDLFAQRTKEIMKKLIEILPMWLKGIEKVAQGYRV